MREQLDEKLSFSELVQRVQELERRNKEKDMRISKLERLINDEERFQSRVKSLLSQYNGIIKIGSGALEVPTIILNDGVTAPSARTGKAILYVNSSGGDAEILFSDGFTGTVVADS